MNCYYCSDFKKIEVKLPLGQTFCNEEEHTLWANKHYGRGINNSGTKSIESIQERLLQMGEEAKKRGYR